MAVLHGSTVRWETVCRAGAVAATAFLLGCVGMFVYRTRHWPLVNDPALMHYVVFLMGRGMVPYREIGDINLPGAYAPEWLSMHLAHLLHLSVAAMWRGMDFGALLLAGWATVRIARPWSWFAGVWAGALFALYHGRDGVGQAGQRDLWVAVLLLWAVSFLFDAMRCAQGRTQGWRLACFGLFISAACTVKPVVIPFLLLLTPFLLWEESARARGRLLVFVAAGFVLPVLGSLAFAERWAAMPALWQVLRVTLPYHASLGDGTVLQLLGRSTLSSTGKLLIVLLVTGLLAGEWRANFRAFRTHPSDGSVWTGSAERISLAGCVLLGLLSFVMQGKGYPYQRYPYVVFLFLFAALEFASAVGSSRKPLRIAGVVGFAFGVLFCAPAYLRGVAKARWSMPVSEMETAIRAQASGDTGRDVRGLDGQVQCLDVVSGCTDALLHLHLREATGTIYDEFLFPQTPSGWGIPYTGPAPGAPASPAVLIGQGRFRAELLKHSPRVLIVSAWLFPQGPGDYRELALWPWFDAYLREHYTLVSQQSFARAENGPLGFRVYRWK
jgi:hypothetical protein